MGLLLTSKPVKVAKIKKKTTARGWKDIRPSDEIVIDYMIDYDFCSNGGEYQHDITVHVRKEGESVSSMFSSTFGKTRKFLSLFEFED